MCHINHFTKTEKNHYHHSQFDAMLHDLLLLFEHLVLFGGVGLCAGARRGLTCAAGWLQGVHAVVAVQGTLARVIVWLVARLAVLAYSGIFNLWNELMVHVHNR